MDPLQRLLERRIAHAKAWCARRTLVEDSFHEWSSLELSTVSESERLRLLDIGEDVLTRSDDPHSMVEHVCSHRANAYNAGRLLHLESMKRGRILVFEPHRTLSHGVEEAQTGGFLNGDCGPPWDTWLTLLPERVDPAVEPSGPELLSWVPQPFVDLVDSAIRINIEECIYWYEDI